MKQQDSLRSGYESTPYRDQSFRDFDLSRLLGFAALFGVRDVRAPADGLRVLDLGCASGLHLREQAARYPKVRFEGIDFSTTEIEHGRKAAQEAGLRNVELMQADLREVEIESGAYDLVLCHGVFSWVPDDVKERLFLLTRSALAPEGVAAFAYLTYPGWKQLEAFRDLLRMRDDPTRPAEARLRESAKLLRVLRASYDAASTDIHARSLAAMVERMQKAASNAFLHDELGPIHDPCYFMQFVEWAEECGLQYLAETDLGSMAAEGLSGDAQPILEALAPDFLETQQWVDFAVNRAGRSSMLIRSDRPLDRGFTHERLATLDFGSSWWNVTPLDRPPDAPILLESPAGQRLEIADSSTSKMLERLFSNPEQRTSHAELAEAFGHATETQASQTDQARFEPALAALVAKGVLEPRAKIESPELAQRPNA